MTSPVQRPHRRWRIGLLSLAITGLLVSAVPAAATASKTWRAQIRVAGHSPRTCTRWRVVITARQGRRQLSGRVEYYDITTAQYSSEQLGGRWSAGTAANGYGKFSRGVFRDAVILPSRYAAGVPLNFNAVVQTQDGTQTVSTEITPRPNRRHQCG